MQKRIRFGLFTGVLLVLFSGLFGCPQQTNNVNPVSKPYKVAVVLDTGGIDDKSFNAAANEGLQRAIKELGVEGKILESKSESEYQPNLRGFADQNFDMVFAIGFKMAEDIAKVVPEYADVNFVLVDADVPADAKNASGLRFREEQGAFLVGYLAGAVSKSKKVGFVGGEPIDLIKKFEAGYRAGVKTAGLNPTKQVLAAYTNDWNDVEKGRSSTDQMFANGADIVFHAAGKAGLGVIQAAKAKGKGFYAIGVDMDQDGVAPGNVLVSMLKRVDTAVFETIKSGKEGKFASGNRYMDLKDNGIGVSEMKYTKSEIPAEVLANLDTLKQMVIDGKVTIPTKLEELSAFTAPKLK